jgi:hypothetical protein
MVNHPFDTERIIYHSTQGYITGQNRQKHRFEVRVKIFKAIPSSVNTPVYPEMRMSFRRKGAFQVRGEFMTRDDMCKSGWNRNYEERCGNKTHIYIDTKSDSR